jgi:hypothetical protein
MSDNTSTENTGRTPANRRAARIVTATVVAGGIALAGGTAYAANSADPGPKPAAAVPVADVADVVESPAAEVVDPETAALDAYFAAGYTYDDAVVLGAQWNLDPFETKAQAGARLLAGETLPVAPGSSAPQVDPVSGEEMGAVDAFFGAGYEYDDAVTLGALWNVDSWEAKIAGGQKLIAGETLPVQP